MAYARSAVMSIAPEFAHIDTVARPIKSAALVGEPLARDREDQLLEALTTLWGGRYSLLLPIKGTALTPEDTRTLEEFSPDLIVRWSEDIQEQYLEDLRDLTGALGVGKYDVSVMESTEGVRGHPFGGVSMASVVDYLARYERPPDPSNIRLVNATGDAGYLKALSYLWGRPPEDYADFYADVLNGQVVDYHLDGLTPYLRMLRELKGRASPIGLTSYHGVAAASGATGLTGLVLVLTDMECAFDDASLFWNLRTQRGLFTNPNPHLIPWAEDDDVDELAEWIIEEGMRQTRITLASRTLANETLLNLQERLRAALPERVKPIDVWHDRFELGPVTTTSNLSSHQEIRIYGRGERTTEIPTQPLPFANRNDHWITAVARPPGRITHPFDDFQWPAFSGMNRIIGPDVRGGASGGIYEFPYYVRVDGEQLACFSTARWPRVQLDIPDPAVMAQAYLQSHGIESRPSEKARYATQLLRLAGGARRIADFLDRETVRLLWQMKNSKPYTRQQCLGTLKAGTERTDEVLGNLLSQRLLLRGYELQCPTCDLRTWYPLADIDEQFSCTGCLTTLELPLDLPLAYRLNELAARAIDQGALGVLGGVHFFRRIARSSLSFQPCMELTAPDETDIDLLASVDGAVHAMECKSLVDGADTATAASIIEQMGHIHTALEGTSVERLSLYVLNPEIPPPLQEAWDQWTTELQSDPPVRLVTSTTELQRLQRQGQSPGGTNRS